MDLILQKFAGKIDAQSLFKTVEELKSEYIDDGLTKLVIGVLNHLIEQIDEGEKDSEFEIILKALVPPMVDSFAAMLKLKKSCLPCLA